MSLLFEPRDIDFNDLLHQKYSSGYISKHRWKYYHFFTLLLKKHLYRKRNSSHNGWYAVSSSALRDLYGRSGGRHNEKWMHRVIRDDFQQWGVVLHHTEQVAETRKVSRYKILDERLLAGYRLVDTVVPRRHLLPKPVQIKYRGIYGLIQRAAARLKVDNNGALTYINESFVRSLPLKDKPIAWAEVKKGNWYLFRNRVVDVSTYSRWLWHLHKLNRGSYGFKVDIGNTNRLFYLLTQIPSHLRQFVLLEGKQMVEVDVTAAQPLLFTNMILEYCRQQGMDTVPNDVLRWKCLCEESDPDKNLYPVLYQLMVEANLRLDSELTYDPVTGTVKRLRKYTKLFKAEFFTKIFFDKDKKTQMREVFAAEFPTVSDAITHYKKDDYRNLARSLQKSEAHIVIEKVCSQLYAQKVIALPVHDALYVPKEHVGIVTEEIRKAFLEVNLNVQVKIK